jgi:maintenance of morphology protein 1
VVKQNRQSSHAQKALAASKAPPTPAPGAAHVLAKAAYEMASHGAESTDWINVLFAQVMQGYRNDMLAGGGEEGAKLRVEKWLNPEGGRTSWLVCHSYESVFGSTRG